MPASPLAVGVGLLATGPPLVCAARPQAEACPARGLGRLDAWRALVNWQERVRSLGREYSRACAGGTPDSFATSGQVRKLTGGSKDSSFGHRYTTPCCVDKATRAARARPGSTRRLCGPARCGHYIARPRGGGTAPAPARPRQTCGRRTASCTTLGAPSTASMRRRQSQMWRSSSAMK